MNRLLGTDLTLGAAELSRRLAMSESTLRRHLADEGHSLRELREHCRLERALALVQTSSRVSAVLPSVVPRAAAKRIVPVAVLLLPVATQQYLASGNGVSNSIR